MARDTPNRALWVGPLLALFGALSYFTIFYRWPNLRDVPWLNLLILFCAVALSVGGTLRAEGSRRTIGWLGTGFSIFLTCLLCFYIFSYSYRLPSAATALKVGSAVPALTLRDNHDRDVKLTDLRRAVLVFYRGHW